MTNQINEENIRVAAYYIWEQAGRPEGAEKECWMKACEQLFNTQKSTAKKSSVKSGAKSVTKSEKTPAKKTTSKKSSSKPAVKAEPFYGIRK